jgi:hypothetical protein
VVAQSLDWSRLSRAAASDIEAWARADAASRSAVSLVTPGPLRRFLKWGK